MPSAIARLPGWGAAALVPLACLAMSVVMVRLFARRLLELAAAAPEGRAVWGIVVVTTLLTGGMAGGLVGVLVDALRAARDAEAQLRTNDALTGLLIRRRFVEIAEREVELAHRSGRPLSLVLVDLDDFRRVNDKHGHAAGDALLRAVGATLRSVLRSTDVACRWGGDGFALLLPDTDGEGAVRASERVLASLRRASVQAAAVRIGCRASAGVATLMAESATLNLLVDRADIALQSVKHRGKDSTAAANIVASALPARAERSLVRRAPTRAHAAEDPSGSVSLAG